MKAYTGKDPFVFVSYSHADWFIVEPLIVQMKRKLCRVWYDEGLQPGESWNDDLAEHLKAAACVIVFLTEQSMASHYVRSEITYALSKQKKIIPVLLDRSEVPAGLEFELGRIQFLNEYGYAEKAGDGKTADQDMVVSIYKKIAELLPPEVYSQLLNPFLESGGYKLFLVKEDIQFESPTYQGPDRTNNIARIVCTRGEDSLSAEVLFEFGGGYAYDVSYSITQCRVIEDDYFVGSIRGINIVHMIATFELEYPLTGPDFDVLFIFALRIPEKEAPTLRLIDYQITRLCQPVMYEGKELREAAWGASVEERIRKML